MKPNHQRVNYILTYPMIESFKDADDFFDEQYKDVVVPIENIVKYKSIVANKRLSNRRVDTFTKEELSKLTLMNIFKLNAIVNNSWAALNYTHYKNITETLKLHNIERTLIEEKEVLSVINTTLFLVLDYFGNQKGFYDSIINQNI